MVAVLALVAAVPGARAQTLGTAGIGVALKPPILPVQIGCALEFPLPGLVPQFVCAPALAAPALQTTVEGSVFFRPVGSITEFACTLSFGIENFAIGTGCGSRPIPITTTVPPVIPFPSPPVPTAPPAAATAIQMPSLPPLPTFAADVQSRIAEAQAQIASLYLWADG